MWLFPLGFTESQTQPVCASPTVFVGGSRLNGSHTELFHALTKSRMWFCHAFGLVSIVEKIMGEVYITALVCSCGTRTPFHLTVLPSVMNALPVCTSTSGARWAELANSVTTLLTPRLFNYVRKYIIYIHLKKQKPPPKCSVWTNSMLTWVDKCVYLMRSSAKSF